MLDYWKSTEQSNFAKKCKVDTRLLSKDLADINKEIVKDEKQRILAEDNKETNKEKNTGIEGLHKRENLWLAYEKWMKEINKYQKPDS
ncbi:hypothetical protein F8M41_002338 [Gigaspora margarita]|uniref:Uncharacterized protein n=1 Tax=Gigaspora margarita TaxID=4874 RepID=A0A8H4B4Q0_GIGMA|nr:hypothetical protein F8M41_002338 [Gigaspora margarita]